MQELTTNMEVFQKSNDRFWKVLADSLGKAALKCFIGFLGEKISFERFHRIPWRRKSLFLSFSKIFGEIFFFENLQQIPWKKQARALSLILALISSLKCNLDLLSRIWDYQIYQFIKFSNWFDWKVRNYHLREAAGGRVVDVVVDGGDRVVVDKLSFGSLSSSSLWRKKTI